MVEAPIRLSVRCLAGVAVAILAAATAEPSQSIVTLRQGGLLAAHANGFTPDARHRANRDAWGYLTPNVKGAIQFLERAHGFRATHGYSKVIQGFAADLTDKQIEALRLEPLVEAMTVTISMSARQQRAPWGVRSLTALPNGSAADIEQPWTGGVTVYVIDSGITASADLNLKKHVNFTSGPNTDCHGHGTHVAGTIGARDNSEGVTGVAPGVALVGVKVVDCKGEGSSATLLKGVDWVAAHADGPSVVNLSLGGGVSLELDAGIKAAVDFGIFFSIAAGNNSQDACLTSPSLNGFSSCGRGCSTLPREQSGSHSRSRRAGAHWVWSCARHNEQGRAHHPSPSACWPRLLSGSPRRPRAPPTRAKLQLEPGPDLAR